MMKTVFKNNYKRKSSNSCTLNKTKDGSKIIKRDWNKMISTINTMQHWYFT